MCRSAYVEALADEEEAIALCLESREEEGWAVEDFLALLSAWVSL